MDAATCTANPAEASHSARFWLTSPAGIGFSVRPAASSRARIGQVVGGAGEDLRAGHGQHRQPPALVDRPSLLGEQDRAKDCGQERDRDRGRGMDEADGGQHVSALWLARGLQCRRA